jgi:ABC-type branched-subunit amino acid transport system substrate-binding protein
MKDPSLTTILGRVARLAILLLAGATGLLAGAPLARAAELRLGIFLPATGRFADIGAEMKGGYEVALARYKDTPLMLGGEPLTLKIFYYDDEGKADTTLNAVTRAITSDKIDVAVGFLLGDIFIRVMEEFQKAGVPVVTCCSADVALGDIVAAKKLTYVYQLSPTSDDIVGALTAAAVTRLKATKLSILGENNLVGHEDITLIHKWVAEHAPNVQIVSEDLVPPGTIDFTAQLSKIKRLGGQAILGEVLGPSTKILFDQWYDQHIPAVLCSLGAGTSSQTFLDNNRAAVEGAIISNRWWPGKYTSLSEPMLNDYTARYHVGPTNFSVQAFDSAIVAIEAVKNAASLDHAKIADALGEGTFVTAWGVRKFKTLEQGHRMPIDIVIVQVQDGKKVPIYPPSLADQLGTKVVAEPPYAWEKH